MPKTHTSVYTAKYYRDLLKRVINEDAEAIAEAKALFKKICPECGTLFTSIRVDKGVCSATCRVAMCRKKTIIDG